MRNQFFELYKPDSLQDFLYFKEANPKEPMVYVLQHPPENINIMSAQDYGTLVFCLPERSQLVFSAAPFVRKMQKNLKDFMPRDFILCIGDPAIIGLSTYIAGDKTNGLFNMLKWDRQERMYYPLTFDIHQRLETGRMAFKHGGIAGGNNFDYAQSQHDITMKYLKDIGENHIAEQVSKKTPEELNAMFKDPVYLVKEPLSEKPTKRKKKKI